MNKLFFPSTLISIQSKMAGLWSGLEWLGLLACMRIMIVQNKNEEDQGKMAVMINCSWFVTFCNNSYYTRLYVLYDLGSSDHDFLELYV